MRLVEHERVVAGRLGPSERAKRLHPHLAETVAELRRMAGAAKTDAQAELLELEAERVDQARELLRVLEQEQWRQREAAKLYLHGQYDRPELRKVTETWNEDPSHD